MLRQAINREERKVLKGLEALEESEGRKASAIGQYKVPNLEIATVPRGGIYKNETHLMEKQLKKKLNSNNRKETADLIKNLIHEGVPIPIMQSNTRQRKIKSKSFEAISEVFIAYMTRADPDRFEREPSLKNKTFFFPIDFKVYFYAQYFNAFFNKAKVTGEYGTEFSRIGQSDDMAVPDCLFNYLNAIGSFTSDDGSKGMLTLDVPAVPQVENHSIFGNYSADRLNSAAFTAYSVPPTSPSALNFWEKDGTTQEAVIVTGEAINIMTVWEYFDELVTSGKLLKMSSYLSKNYHTKKYRDLFFKGSGVSAKPRMPVDSHVVNLFSQVNPDRSVINPFPGFDPYYSSIFNIFEESEQLFIPHQKFIELPASVPNDEGDQLDFPIWYILCEYVQQVQDLGLGVNASSDELWSYDAQEDHKKIKIKQKRNVYREINAGALNYYATTDAAMMQGQLTNLNEKAMGGSTKINPIRAYKESWFISTNYWMRKLLINSPNALLNPGYAIPKSVEASVIQTTLAFATHQIGRVVIGHGEDSEQYVPFIDFSKISPTWWDFAGQVDVEDQTERQFYKQPFGVAGDPLTGQNYPTFSGVFMVPAWAAAMAAPPPDRASPLLPFHTVAANFDNVLIKSNTSATPAFDDYSPNFRNVFGGPSMLSFTSWDRVPLNTLYPTPDEGKVPNLTQYVVYKRMCHTRVGTQYPSVASDMSLQMALPLSMDNTTFDLSVNPEKFIANLCRGSITGLKAGVATPYENSSAGQFQPNASFSRKVTELQTQHSHVTDIEGVSFYATNDAKCQLLAMFTDLVQAGTGLVLEATSSLLGIEEGTIADVVVNTTKAFQAAGNVITNTKSITDISTQDKKIKKAENETESQFQSRRIMSAGKGMFNSTKTWSKKSKKRK